MPQLSPESSPLVRDGRYVCTQDAPWVPTMKVPVIHPNAIEVKGSQESGWPSGDTVQFWCPHCGHKWREELPQ